LQQEEIRMRIDESREALVQKIEQLEEKVTDTVESATATVAEATEAVRETVQTATASVSETVDSVAGAVQGTAETVRDSVEGAVDAVKDALDISKMVERYPWVMLAGSVGVGYLAGQVLSSDSKTPAIPISHFQSMAHSTEPQFANRARESSYPGTTTGAVANGSTMGLPPASPSPIAAPQSPKPSIFGGLVGAFQPEISKLTGLAIDMGVDSLKQVLMKNVPPALKQQVSSMIDDVAKRLGGQFL